MEEQASLARLLGRCSREFARGGWIFVGFNLPVLAAQTARVLGFSFFEVYEAGVATYSRALEIPSSTTDFSSYDNALCWRGSSLDVLSALVPKLDGVILDAANIDLAGQTNTSAIGDLEHPRVRLPGGGGSADAAVGARELVYCFGGNDVARIQAKVEHVTASPNPDTPIRLLTRWGELRLGTDPAVLKCIDGPEGAQFIDHVCSLGVEVNDAELTQLCSDTEYEAALEILSSSYARGYEIGRDYLA
jgi:acyl CoA:acetate/3-ketoacid CoA transferase beta subunit